VQWGDEHLAVDTERNSHLGTGQLLRAPDLQRRRVTFKLHRAFPDRGYILTDTSSAPMAPRMHVPVAPGTAGLSALQATDKIWVFVNGVPGSGAMGFQPAILGNPAGRPTWSPFWDHFALRWEDPNEARVVRSAGEVQELVAVGRLRQYRGTPETHPEGFVVHCPVPVISA
jgi:hypothetical protein